ncbi:MAG: OmpH family outer membrane protein [Bacteroidetes bacterium]|nr:MAG: OmpH family outer membrane protein [Bacteroidota bacterium]
MFVIATLFSLVACQNTDPNKKADKTAPAPLKGDGNKTYKFAYVNIDTLLERYTFYKDMKKDLETKGRIIDSDLRNRGSNFQNDVVAYKKGVGSMTIDQAKQTEQGLARREQELAQYQQTVEANFAKEEQEMSKKLNENVNDYIKKYAGQNGYTFIFSYSRSSTGVGMMYGDASLDITTEVVKGLNAEYKPEKK